MARKNKKREGMSSLLPSDQTIDCLEDRQARIAQGLPPDEPKPVREGPTLRMHWLLSFFAISFSDLSVA
jgi:hypothetical protein